MKTNFTLLATVGSLLTTATISGQVGINSTTPASTLDIVAKNATGTSTNVDGVLIPRVTRQRVQDMVGVPSSTLVYINEVSSGTQTGTAVNIDAVGYYYFNGTAWVKLHNPNNTSGSGTNIYNTDGTLTGNRTVSQGVSTLAFTSTATNGFSVDGSTLSVDAANNRVGIGTVSPVQPLHVSGSARITGSSGTPSTVMGRNLSGDVSNVSVGSGLSLSGGVLTANAVPISLVNFPFLFVNNFGGGTYQLDSQNAPNYTLWVGNANAAGVCDILLPNPNTMLGRTLNIIAPGGAGLPVDVCTATSTTPITYLNSTLMGQIPTQRRITIQASPDFGWVLIMKDY